MSAIRHQSKLKSKSVRINNEKINEQTVRKLIDIPLNLQYFVYVEMAPVLVPMIK